MSARRVGDAIVEVLQAASVRTVFGIPGVHTLGLYDAFVDAPTIRHVLPRHEQGAAFAADGYARVTNSPGVCSTTTGPGTFNTLAAVAEAWSDSSPVVILAGQIDAAYDGRGQGILHETPDQGRAFEAVTARVERPRTAQAVPQAVADALVASMTGRPRPAYVELPTDLLTQPFPHPTPEVRFPSPVAPASAPITAAAAALAAAERVLIVPGAGVQRSRASAPLRQLAARLGAPVVTSITGSGTIPADDPLWAGALLPGRPECRELFEEADTVLVVGCRLDEIQTARWTLPLRGLIHVDVDPDVIDRSYPATVGVVGDARLATEALLAELGPGRAHDAAWGPSRAAAARQAALAALSPSDPEIGDAMLATRDAIGREAIVVHDAARLNSWTGFAWPVFEPDGSIFPWGSATLGFAVGAANGAAVGAPGRRVVAACGDGGFLFTATELATAVAHDLDVTVLVHDDGAFGSIAGYQLRHHGRTYATDLHNPDLVAFCRSFGVPAQRVEDIRELPGAMAKATGSPGPSAVILATPLGSPWD